tara:strand:+ start:674 stop:1099 length:426 start_codon:yes stop_codon:yes gene_type:complete
MSSNSDASDILEEILEESKQSEPDTVQQPSEPDTVQQPSEPEKKPFSSEDKPTRNLILVGTKPIMTYVNSTLTQLSTLPTVTIKARGKRITQAVDVSQFILKRMHSVGYEISAVRISSDMLESKDGKTRNVSTIEIDISHT